MRGWKVHDPVPNVLYRLETACPGCQMAAKCIHLYQLIREYRYQIRWYQQGSALASHQDTSL